MKDLDTWERILTFILAVATFLGTPLAWIFGRRQRDAGADVHISTSRKLDAETLQVIVTAMGLVIDELKERVTDLETEIKQLKLENANVKGMESEIKELKWENTSLKERVSDLEKQLTERDKKIDKLQKHVAELERKNENKDQSSS